jgi:hypothetical protein
MNCGPATATLLGEDPDSFALFTSAGFTSAYLASAAPGCTYCYDNPLVTETGSDAIIDHVLLKGQGIESAVSQTRRVFDQPVPLNVSGTVVASPLSDHYGVEVTLSPPGLR